MPQEYARLDLLRDIATATGGTSHQIVVMRPTARELIGVFEESKVTGQLKRFVGSCCRAINGTGKDLSEFHSADLDAADGAELAAILAAMSEEADRVEVGAGDGITEPLVYTLRHPIELAAADGGKPSESVRQIQFQARKLGDLSDFLDSRGAGNEFYAFMRAFGTLLGTKLPMTDGIIGALDFLDYLVIRRKIMGKLTASRGRWKKASI
jgi:hypothetical protein